MQAMSHNAVDNDPVEIGSVVQDIKELLYSA